MSYSKGPWIFHKGLIGFISKEDDQSHGMFCSIGESYGANSEADGRLMASAPAMYEALKVALNRMEVVHWVDSIGDHGPDNVLEQEIGMVKKAIQQAEGGE